MRGIGNSQQAYLYTATLLKINNRQLTERRWEVLRSLSHQTCRFEELTSLSTVTLPYYYLCQTRCRQSTNKDGYHAIDQLLWRFTNASHGYDDSSTAGIKKSSPSADNLADKMIPIDDEIEEF